MSAPNDASSLTLRRKQRTLFANRVRKETAFQNGLQIFVDLEYNSIQRGAITYTPTYYETNAGALVTTPAERDAYIASVPTKLPRLPGAPTITGVSGSNSAVEVTFTPSSQAVSSPVTSYTVTSTPDGITASGSASPITVTGLTNGTAYTFRVVANNANGSSPPSAASGSVTPATIPSAPVAISVEAGDGLVTVTSITPPVDDGGSPIQYYKVTPSPYFGNQFEISYPLSSPTSLLGFTNGTTYTLGVTAINGVGESSPVFSDPVTPEVPIPSGNVYTSPTSNSSVSLSTQSPFEGGYSYEFTSPSYLSISGDNSWALGTRDFTIEWFQYQTDSNPFPRIFEIGQYPSTSIGCSIEGGTFYAWFSDGFPVGNPIPYKNQWVHFAIVRRSGVLRVYKNGTLFGSQNSSTSNITDNTTTLYIGAEVAAADPGTQFTGFMTNIRIVKGLAVYIGDFTVPTSNLTLTASANPYGGSNTEAIPDQYTKLLLVPSPTIRSFTTVGTTSWTAPAGVTSVEYLVVGGGGGGGGAAGTGSGGGGGGGAVLTGTHSVIPGSTYNVIVGDGGTAGANTSTDGGDGMASSFDTIIAGGGGRGFNSRAVNETGSLCKGGAAQSGITAPTGGSGGGTRNNDAGGGFGPGQGAGAGGGGGAGGAGQDGYDATPGDATSAVGGPGGIGVSNSISGSAVIYGAGGKGGNESFTNVPGTAGAVNTGKGGGGAEATSMGGTGAAGGVGGSGIVILKY